MGKSLAQGLRSFRSLRQEKETNRGGQDKRRRLTEIDYSRRWSWVLFRKPTILIVLSLLSSPACVSCLTWWFYYALFTNEKMKLRKAIGLRVPQRPVC